MQILSPIDSVGGYVIDDLKQQLGDVKLILDSVVSELWKMKMQIGDRPTVDHSLVCDPSRISNAREELGNRKMQIVMDVSVCGRCPCWSTIRCSCCPDDEVTVM
jgi:hypothetical protein